VRTETGRTRDFPIFEYGQALYDGIFFVDYLPEGGAGLTARDLLAYVNAGGNLVISGTNEGSSLLREVAAQVPPVLPPLGVLAQAHCLGVLRGAERHRGRCPHCQRGRPLSPGARVQARPYPG
jgi:hypothetical protein